ncbi:RloB family protein [Chitinophaga rhizophila]|uniref:RloB family protein n=1 Tax=Chitinophaga rhizophila TaxID=2866212 RepID=A0ABS7G9W3_9BACT|nr:RloB family protein [Chitinophaga rhizophila]MBW8683323.1 RloB family protein [Chitinophaga rhizophila]
MAQNPWDIKTNDERPSETINVFIIFCEDAVSEPEYFRSFQTDKLKVNPIGNARWGKLNLYETIKQCLADGLMEFKADAYRIKEGVTDNIWCVYDRDANNKDLDLVTEEKKIPWSVSIQTATETGLNIAWSNDAFELWILLHFEDIEPGKPVHRDYIYQRLTEIFKIIQPRSPELDELTGNPQFYYKYGFKRLKYFADHVLSKMKPLTPVAIERAEKLAAYYQNDIPFHERNPCTMVHLLVKELMANDGVA